ncbi:MAG: hypothetical protein Q4F71_11595 [Paracoccus sp. (in: a-proteobacteria)]|nr:hypothetical protein [Paracoccus sp. (in: a-proteobacteria)]
MTRFLAVLSLPLLMAACDDGMVRGTATVFKSFGTTQCNPQEGRLEALAAELRGVGVDILDKRAGDDGMMRIALCGAPDGRIGIFTIPETQTQAAASAGFSPYQAAR